MTRDGGAEGEGAPAPHHFTDEELDWVREHLTQLRQSVSGQRVVLQSLGIGFVLGLAAYLGGYALKATATRQPFPLLGDFLYALGWALWTGVVVALFVEIIPRAKQRQIKRALDVYESALREKARSASAHASKRDA